MSDWFSRQFSFELYEAPIVIEPGVGALEINVFICDSARPSNDPKSRFKLWWRFSRVDLNEQTAQILPFIPTMKYPHIFTMAEDLDVSPFLLVYDLSGRLAFIYKKEAGSNAWVCHNVIDEIRGKTVSQFSVRFSFNTSADRNEFVAAIEKMMEASGRDKTFDQKTMRAAMRLLGRSKMSPVSTTVAVEKTGV